MKPVSFFYLQHGRVHSSKVSSVPSIADQIFGGLTDQQMRVRPGKGLNSLVWLLWHMARVEDCWGELDRYSGPAAARRGLVLSPRSPPHQRRQWHDRKELIEFSARVDVAAVRAYRDAVGLKTRDVVATLGSATWAETVSTADAARAPDWFKVFVGQPRALELGTSALTHNAIHLGEAVTIRSLPGLVLG